MYDLKSSELPIGGYTLILRGPTLHQHKAVVGALRTLDLSPIVEAVKPALDSAKASDGAFMEKLTTAIPTALRALVENVLLGGVETLVDAAAVCLDSRTNHRRLSGQPNDPDEDRAKVGEFECGPDGSSYLHCERLRGWIRERITVDQAIWTVTEAWSLGGYGDLGKDLIRAAATTLGTVTALTGAPKAQATAITH